MDILDKLKNAGLTGNESKVYYELLIKGSLNANNLSKNISLDRTLTYTLLTNLIEKGLVSYIIKENKKYFCATNPNNLMNSVKEKEAEVSDLISELKKIEVKKDNKSEVLVYEGKDAIRMYYNEFKKAKETCSFGATGRAYDLLYESPRLVKELLKLGFKSRIITSKEFEKHPMTKIKNIETRYLNLKSDVTTTIFSDKIVIHSIIDKPFLTIIKNEDVAKSYQAHFEVLWNSAKK